VYLLHQGNWCSHRFRGRQIFGGAKNFCPNIRKLARKRSKDNDLQKKKRLHFTGRKAVQASFLLKLHPSLPKFILTWNMISRKQLNENRISKKWIKKSLHFHCHFCKINAHTAILRRFAHVLPKFLHILSGFSPIQNFWGCGCTPPPTPVDTAFRRIRSCVPYFSKSWDAQLPV